MDPVTTRARQRRLWRDVVGAVLRESRSRRGERLADVAVRAGVSPQYLSEVERGRKEPSSEILAAVADALDLTLADLTRRVTLTLDAEPRRQRHLRPVAPAAENRPTREPAVAPAPQRTPTGRAGGEVLLLAA